ncbi:MAG: hypothetical protein V4635_09605 [Bacteroidota bacterium]
MINKPRIKVDNPCPMTHGRLKDGDNFSCKSCNQTLVDFRDKTEDEIIKVISVKKTCGIFNDNQVTVPDFSFTNKLIFKILAVLAVFGFNVKPLNAQTNQAPKDSASIQKQKTTTNTKTENKVTASDSTQAKSINKKWWRKNKKHKYRIIGTPSF